MLREEIKWNHIKCLFKARKVRKRGKKRNRCNEKSTVMGMVSEIDEIWANR